MGAPPSHRASLLTLRPTLAAGIPAALQRYVHAGRQLVDDRPLAEQRVAPAATLDLRLSLLGGAPKKKGKEKGDKPILSIQLGSLGTVAVRGKACEGWWNHMSRPPPARPHDSLRRLTLRHHHRTMSTSWVALAVAR